MTAIALSTYRRHVACNYRPLILIGWACLVFGVFWFASRYPQLLTKAEHVGLPVSSMAYGSERFPVPVDAALWQRILYGAANWLDGMKIGMSFGVLLGALLHTTLRYYSLKIGKSLYLNSLKGALVGVPTGICANCSVPAICGLTRGHGRVEVALGFLFSSPNFNPVVVAMTFAAMPLAMSVTKYAILLFVILCLVPFVIKRLERDKLLPVLTVGNEGELRIRGLAPPDCSEPFVSVLGEMARDYARNVWALAKPTLTLMLMASVVASALLTLIPWQSLLSEVTPLRAIVVSLISTFMPVPIALDVMFAAVLNKQGISGGYVMLFLMTLGTFSVVPFTYLWREVSKRLAAILFGFFMLVGVVSAFVF